MVIAIVIVVIIVVACFCLGLWTGVPRGRLGVQPPWKVQIFCSCVCTRIPLLLIKS